MPGLDRNLRGVAALCAGNSNCRGSRANLSADFDRLSGLLQVWISVRSSRLGLGISGKRLVFKGFSPIFFRAGDEIRTRDVQLGKLAFYR